MTSSAVWDGVASLLIGLLLIVVAYLLIRRNATLLIDERSPANVRERLRQAVAQEPWVAEVAELTAVYIGPKQLLGARACRAGRWDRADSEHRGCAAVAGRARDRCGGNHARRAGELSCRSPEAPPGPLWASRMRGLGRRPRLGQASMLGSCPFWPGLGA